MKWKCSFPLKYFLIYKLSLKEWIIFITIITKKEPSHICTRRSTSSQPERGKQLRDLKQPKPHRFSLAFPAGLPLQLKGGENDECPPAHLPTCHSYREIWEVKRVRDQQQWERCRRPFQTVCPLPPNLVG